jgi:ribosome-binding protein aMBF1 (putative translation factor)
MRSGAMPGRFFVPVKFVKQAHRGMNATTNHDQPAGTPLRTARLRAGLSAISLAGLSGTTEPRIYQLERRRFRPRNDEAHRLAQALGLPVNELFPDGVQPEWLA